MKRNPLFLIFAIVLIVGAVLLCVCVRTAEFRPVAIGCLLVGLPLFISYFLQPSRPALILPLCAFCLSLAAPTCVLYLVLSRFSGAGTGAGSLLFILMSVVGLILGVTSLSRRAAIGKVGMGFAITAIVLPLLVAIGAIVVLLLLFTGAIAIYM